MTPNRTRLVVYWLATIAAAALFAIPGAALLVRDYHFASEMARLGYPAYFLPPFGVLKILGAVTILLPGIQRMKEWAYAGMVFDVSFAVWSRAAVGDPLLPALLPLVIGALATASWALRPVSRKL